MANRVIAGDLTGADVFREGTGVFLRGPDGYARPLDRYTVAEWEQIDTDSKKSATSAVGRALVGAALVGPAGLLAGITARSKSKHTVAIALVDGARCLLELDDATWQALRAKVF